MARLLQSSVFWLVWRHSALRGWFARLFLSCATATERSGYTAVLDRLNVRLAHKKRLMQAVRASAVYRMYGAVFSAGRCGMLSGTVFRGGATSLLLLAAGLYALLDYALRDVFAIPLLSSVWDELLLLVCVVWILCCRLDRETPLAAKTTPMDVPILQFFAVGFTLLCVVSPYPAIQLSGYRATVQNILWFFVIVRLLRDRRDFLQLYLVLTAVAAGLALHGIYQYIAAVPMPAGWVSRAEVGVRTRVYSIFGSPNIMGSFMVLFAPMAAGLAYAAQKRWQKLLAWGGAGCMGLACLFTLSRGAWLGMATAVLLFALLVDRRLFAALLAAGFAVLLTPFVRSRLAFLFTEDYAAESAGGGRAVRWTRALYYLRQGNPWTGLGLGMYGGAVAMQNQVSDTMIYAYTDNYYLKILAEMGYVGLASFLAMLLGLAVNAARTLVRTARERKQRLNRHYPLCAGMCSGLVGVLVHCFFENIFEEPYMLAIFWMVAGLLLWSGFARVTPDEAKNSRSRNS